MTNENNVVKIQYLEREILKLKAEYTRLLRETGKFNEMRTIKVKLRAVEAELVSLI